MSHAHSRSFREASASQNVPTNIPREKLAKVTLLLAPQTEQSNGTKDNQLLNKTVKIIHDVRTPTDDKRHLQLKSNETNNIYLIANIKLKS